MAAHDSTADAVVRRTDTGSPTASAVTTGTNSYPQDTKRRCVDALR